MSNVAPVPSKICRKRRASASISTSSRRLPTMMLQTTIDSRICSKTIERPMALESLNACHKFAGGNQVRMEQVKALMLEHHAVKQTACEVEDKPYRLPDAARIDPVNNTVRGVMRLSEPGHGSRLIRWGVHGILRPS